MSQHVALDSQYTQMMTELLTKGKTQDMFWRLMEFWDDPELVQWFQSHGYTLYSRVYSDDVPTTETIPGNPFEEVVSANYPYAYHDARRIAIGDMALRARNSSGKVVYGQDSERRHVAMKLVLDDSDEHHILRFLRDQDLDTLRENCIVPVLDLFPFKGFFVAVMPRWGIHIRRPRTHTMREILQIIHSMLKGLAFLHSNNIIHHDMKMDNVLINHFGDDEEIFNLLNIGIGIHDSYSSPRADLRKEGKLLYGVMDFDISLMAPPDINREEYRRPYQDSRCGSFNQPYDTMQGEFDYNPFAFDVGTLGVELCREYQHYARHVPMLAPLLDKMTTWDIKNRFTAAEALQFFEEMRSDLTEDQLNVKEHSEPIFMTHDKYDRWRELPEEFQRKWASYRQPPTPFMMKVLRAIHCSGYMPYCLIPSIRWFFSKLTFVPRFIWAKLVGCIGFRR